MEDVTNELVEDQNMQKKKERKRLELEKRKEKRIENNQQKKSEDVERQVKVKEYDYFTVHFKEECDAVNHKLECKGLKISDKMKIADHFQELTESYEKLLKFVNDSTIFLRPFQLEQAQKLLNKIQNDITCKRNEMIPKKKFAFKAKKKNTLPEKEIPLKVNTSKFDFSGNERGITEKTNETILMRGDEINQRDISLSKLESCRVELEGYAGTVHLSDIKNCVILCGPVSGSVFVDNCTSSKVITGCQQLRIHNTTDTDFYLHVTSRAIIEDTTRVRFAPYNWDYKNLNEDFVKSGLNKESNNWDSVDDFNWLAMDTASPNWSILPENERTSLW